MCAQPVFLTKPDGTVQDFNFMSGVYSIGIARGRKDGAPTELHMGSIIIQSSWTQPVMESPEEVIAAFKHAERTIPLTPQPFKNTARTLLRNLGL